MSCPGFCSLDLHQSVHRSSPCRGPCQKRHHSGPPTHWSTILSTVSVGRSIHSMLYSRMPIASPLSARTFFTPKLRMMTLDFSLTRLYWFSVVERIHHLGHNIHAKSAQDGVRVLANNAGIASNTNLIGCLRDGATHDDHLGVIARNGRGESSIGRNSGGSTTSTSLGTAILACIACGGLFNLLSE